MNNKIKNNSMSLVVKKFSAQWCGPCRALAPVLDEMKRNYGSSVIFETIDVDENEVVANMYGVRSVPTVVIEKNGKEVSRFAGLQSKLADSNAINENLG